MGKMIIAIDIQVGSRNFESYIEWQGGEHEIRNVMNFVDQMREAFTHSTLRYMSSMGWHSDSNQQEAQMMAVLYTVLQRGAICNYAASEDIEAGLMVRDAAVTGSTKEN